MKAIIVIFEALSQHINYTLIVFVTEIKSSQQAAFVALLF